MRVLNLVFAIIYTVIYALMLVIALFDGDSDMFIGGVFLSGPVIVNWITFAKLK